MSLLEGNGNFLCPIGLGNTWHYPHDIMQHPFSFVLLIETATSLAKEQHTIYSTGITKWIQNQYAEQETSFKAHQYYLSIVKVSPKSLLKEGYRVISLNKIRKQTQKMHWSHVNTKGAIRHNIALMTCAGRVYIALSTWYHS